MKDKGRFLCGENDGTVDKLRLKTKTGHSKVGKECFHINSRGNYVNIRTKARCTHEVAL